MSEPAVAGAEQARHSYSVGFWVSAGILAGSAVVCALVLPSGTLALAAGPPEPLVRAPPAAVTPAAVAPAAVTTKEMNARDR
jgi:hypothetical protein